MHVDAHTQPTPSADTGINRTAEAGPKVTVRLFGPFSMMTSDRKDITPTSRKSKALIAMLALAPDGRRSRSWLQDRLWSEKDQARGRASLRRELSDLRRLHAVNGVSLLESTGEDVILNHTSVRLDLHSERPPAHYELLEGLDVGDPEFEYWLSEERAYWYATLSDPSPDVGIAGTEAVHPTKAALRPSLVLSGFNVLDEDTAASRFAHGLVAELETALGALIGGYALKSGPGMTEVRNGYLIDGSVHGHSPVRLHVRVSSLIEKTILWNGRFVISDADSFPYQEELARKIVDAIQKSLSDGNWANVWSDVPMIGDAWTSFQKARVQENFARRTAWSRAIDHYRRAIRAAPEFLQARISLGFCLLDGVRLCWEPTEEAAIKAARNLAEEVLLASPEYPLAIALGAFADAACGDFDLAVEKMKVVFMTSDESPELTAYFGAVQGYAGDLEREIDLCLRALRLTPHPPAWIWTNLALARLMTGERGVGPEFATVLESDPENVRALIVQTVQNVRRNDVRRARQTAKSILAIEPSFTAERWRNTRFFKDIGQHRQIALDLAKASL